MKLVVEEKDATTKIELFIGGLRRISIECREELIQGVFDMILSSFGDSVKLVKEKMAKTENNIS